jgi:shikimate kinase
MSKGMKNSLVLMGCKHCGKSTQGKLLAQKLGLSFFDTDDEIARLRGIDARTLYRIKGIAEFTLAEEEACCEKVDEAEQEARPVGVSVFHI